MMENERILPIGGVPDDTFPPPPEMPDADLSSFKRKLLDGRYGDTHPRQVFDIIYPNEGDGPFPVLLHIHGGGFEFGHKRDFHIQELLDCVNHGYAFASCSYRRSGDAPFPAAVLDCRKFIDYLHRNAKELNIDDSRICTLGGSAGGNLSALMGMNIEKFYGETEDINASVACAVDWYGPIDFPVMDEQMRKCRTGIADHNSFVSPESKYMGAPLCMFNAEYVALSNPTTYISDKMVPMLIQHGTKDALVPYPQSENFYKAIVEKGFGDRAHFLPIKNAIHDDICFKLPMNMAIVYAFLDKYLYGIEPSVALEDMPRIEGMPPKEPDFIPMGPPPLSKEILDGIKNKFLDVPYASESISQVMDIYLPDGNAEKPWPVIVHIHGGAFMMCSKRDDSVEPMLRGLERGYAVVSIEYRKSGEARFPAQVYDAKAAIRWIRAHAKEYNFDAERIAVWGPSSGGWLSSFVAVTNDNPTFEDLEQGNAEFSSRVQACVDWCGPCGGFLDMDKAFEKSGYGRANHNRPVSPESMFLGAPILSVPELVRLACPITHVTKDTVPFIIIHGEKDQVVPVEQSIAFAEKINSVAGEGTAKLHIVPGKPHHGDPWYHELWVSTECLDFLDGVFKK